jgi:integrase
MPKSRKKRKAAKRVLALPDLEQAKSAVLNTLTSKSGQRTYDHAITEFVEWYCSEPRRAFTDKFAPCRRSKNSYEAAESGLLSPELAAGIRRVKGVRRLRVRVGNWLTVEQGKRLLHATSSDTLRSKRNRAMLSLLIGCGLRRAELLGLTMNSIQLREEHWVIADLIRRFTPQTIQVRFCVSRFVDA